MAMGACSTQLAVPVRSTQLAVQSRHAPELVAFYSFKNSRASSVLQTARDLRFTPSKLGTTNALTQKILFQLKTGF